MPTRAGLAVLVALLEAPGLYATPDALTDRVNELLALDDVAFDEVARQVRERLQN